MSKKNLVAITDLPLHIWRPTEAGQPYLGMIGTLPMLFKGASREAVEKAADDWRYEEAAKEKRKKANAAARAQKLQEARKAKAARVVQ